MEMKRFKLKIRADVKKSRFWWKLLVSVILVLNATYAANATSLLTDFVYSGVAGGSVNWPNNQAFGDFYISDGGMTDTSNVSHGDMYDYGMYFEVCTTSSCTPDAGYTTYSGVGTANTSTGFYSGARSLTSSLYITASYKFSKTIAAGRMLVQLENNTASDITKQVRVRTNLGSDSTSYLKYQSSGGATLSNYYTYSGTAYTSSSYWFISSDQSSLTNNATGSDPIASFVFGKSGSTVSPTTMYLNDNMYTMFTVTIPANTSKYLIFAFGMGGINPLNNSLGGAYTGVTTYLTDIANWPTDLTSDLTSSQLNSVLNWNITPDTTPPSFVSSNSFSVAENLSTSATAASIKVSESATVTISSGLDSSLFNISKSDSVTALIKFKTSPDYEAPIDSGANNVYDLTLTATDDAGNSATQSITITVTNVLDTSSFNSLTISRMPIYRSSVTITADVSVSAKVTFKAGNVVIAGCKNLSANGSGSSFTVNCSWKPSTRGNVLISAIATPTSGAISGTTSSPVQVNVTSRTGSR
jgi:hypothetical protein